MHCKPVSISSFHQVKTGFAMIAKSENSRQEMLDDSLELASINAKLEESSDLVALQIPSVPVSIITESGPRAIDAELVFAKIILTTGVRPIQVQPHGKCRPGVPHRNWHALFMQDNAPRAGLSLVAKLNSVNAVWASMPLVAAPALQPARTAAPACTRKPSARPSLSVAFVGDPTHRILGTAVE